MKSSSTIPHSANPKPNTTADPTADHVSTANPSFSTIPRQTKSKPNRTSDPTAKRTSKPKTKPPSPTTSTHSIPETPTHTLNGPTEVIVESRLRRSKDEKNKHVKIEINDDNDKASKKGHQSKPNNNDDAVSQKSHLPGKPNLCSRLCQCLRRKFGKNRDTPPTGRSSTPRVATGKRTIVLNTPQPLKYTSNLISTSKYSLCSFIFIFLYEQFRRYSNIFFLFIIFLQQLPGVSPTGKFTTLIPFTVILSVSAIKEILEDIKRHKGDTETNNRMVDVLHPGDKDAGFQFIKIKWKALLVGEFVRIENDKFFPADILLLSSSEAMGMAYIETSNLDGETNLKVRQAHPKTTGLIEPQELSNVSGSLECVLPNRLLYDYTGSLKLAKERSLCPLGPDQLLLRGSKLRNTKWIIGLVVYTGSDTKLMMNSTKPPLKRSTLDQQTNNQIVFLFIILILISLLSAMCSYFVANREELNSYLLVSTDNSESDQSKAKLIFYNFLTFIILYNNLIPISLSVTLEVVRFVQAKFINRDMDMYYKETNTWATAKTSNLNEDLGCIRYIFSDKTGTLTRNIMEFKGCSVAGVTYSPQAMFPRDAKTENIPLIKAMLNNENSAIIREFLVLLAVCHSVIPEKKHGPKGETELIYQAASPDEKALVMGAERLGFKFLGRTPAYVEISALGKIERYEILNLIEFTSTRKRMTVVIKTPEGVIKLYCKGADSVILERVINNKENHEVNKATNQSLDTFSTQGLRTLCCAARVLDENEYSAWNANFQRAANTINGREEAIASVAETLEKNMNLLGATAIEDKLQDLVPESIADFMKAKIGVWVLTGDKQETAINIGYSCRLLTQKMVILIINQDNETDTEKRIDTYCKKLNIPGEGATMTKKQLLAVVLKDFAVIIDGNTLTYALSENLKRKFVCLCCHCKAVIVCRTSPLQKAEVVESVIAITGAVTLAVGDGANDVAMIQKAQIGVGISGNEGLQAAGASDYSISQFHHLRKLLFVHGAWNHDRVTKTIFYSFYKNICLYIIELWFALYSAWSGQVIFERWTIGCYNMLFTCMQPLALGIFDQDCNSAVRLANPQLYQSYVGKFNSYKFLVWIFTALLHSILLFWLPWVLVGPGIIWKAGQEGSYLIVGNIIYTYVVVVVSLTAGLETTAWNKYTHISIWGSILLWFLFLLGYSFFWNIYLSFANDIHGIAQQVFTAPLFWFGLIIIPTACLLPDFIYKTIQVQYFKTMSDEFRETQGFVLIKTPTSASSLPGPSKSDPKIHEKSTTKADKTKPTETPSVTGTGKEPPGRKLHRESLPSVVMKLIKPPRTSKEVDQDYDISPDLENNDIDKKLAEVYRRTSKTVQVSRSSTLQQASNGPLEHWKWQKRHEVPSQSSNNNDTTNSNNRSSLDEEETQDCVLIMPDQTDQNKNPGPDDDDDVDVDSNAEEEVSFRGGRFGPVPPFQRL